MKKVRKMSKIWIKEFEIKYKKSLPLLIEAYTLYYGEEKREVISDMLTNTPFLFLLSYIGYLNAPDIPKNDFTKVLISYFKYMNRTVSLMERLGMKKSAILNKEIELASIIPYLWKTTEQELLKYFITSEAMGFVIFTNNNEDPIITLPVYFVNESNLFHELNHLFITPSKEKNLFPNEVVEELINELMARDIRKIYQSLNGKPITCDIKLEDAYSGSLYLIKDFYERFKELIKKSVKEQDFKILEDNLGKRNLHAYCNLVKKLYAKEKIDQNDLKMLMFLENLMIVFYTNKQKEYKRTRDI